MSFFSDIVDGVGQLAGNVVKVVSAPLTIPLQFGGQVAQKAIGSNPLTDAYRNLSSAPYDLLQGGQSFKEVLAKNQGALQVASAVGSSALTGGVLGFDPSAISGVTDLFGNNQNVNPIREATTYESAAPATPIRIAAPESQNNLMPIVLIGGAGIVALLLFSKR